MVKIGMTCPEPDEYGYCTHEDPNDEYAYLHESGYGTLLSLVFLPHSCNEWIIGGPEEVKLLIEDLQEILKNQESKEINEFSR